jgi:hypothetical protein
MRCTVGASEVVKLLEEDLPFQCAAMDVAKPFREIGKQLVMVPPEPIRLPGEIPLHP